MKTVTIPDPAAVAAWLDKEEPSQFSHFCYYGFDGWSTCHWLKTATDYFRAEGATPDELLANIRAEIAKRQEPIERLRREADALNLQLVPKP
jgi:hypothetical protein